MRLRVESLALLSRLGIWRSCELWCRLQTWLWSWVAMALAQAGHYSSDLIPSLETSICNGSSPRNGKKTKKKKYIQNGNREGRYQFIMKKTVFSSADIKLRQKKGRGWRHGEERENRVRLWHEKVEGGLIGIEIMTSSWEEGTSFSPPLGKRKDRRMQMRMTLWN